MYAPRFQIAGYEALPRAAKLDLLRAMMHVLVEACRAEIRLNPSTPKLYAARIRYLREPPDEDNWQDVARTIELGTADCEDLVAWRLAELREAGEDAHLLVREYEDRGRLLFHVLVQRADGEIEDPSRNLGMT